MTAEVDDVYELLDARVAKARNQSSQGIVQNRLKKLGAHLLKTLGNPLFGLQEDGSTVLIEFVKVLQSAAEKLDDILRSVERGMFLQVQLNSN